MRNVGVLHGRWMMVRWQGMVRVIRFLSHHIVSAIAIAIRRLAHGRPHGRPGLIPGVIHVWRVELRTALLRWHVVVVGPRGGRHWRHAIPGHKGLRLRVESVSVEAAGNRMLALRIMGVDVNREGAKSIRYSCLRHRSGSRLVRALVERGRWWLLLRPAVLLLR